jgi:hypothetical protein
VSPNGDPGEAIAPDFPTDYIVAGRDDYNNGTAKPRWTAFTYRTRCALPAHHPT